MGEMVAVDPSSFPKSKYKQSVTLPKVKERVMPRWTKANPELSIFNKTPPAQPPKPAAIFNLITLCEATNLDHMGHVTTPVLSVATVKSITFLCFASDQGRLHTFVKNMKGCMYQIFLQPISSLVDVHAHLYNVLCIGITSNYDLHLFLLHRSVTCLKPSDRGGLSESWRRHAKVTVSSLMLPLQVYFVFTVITFLEQSCDTRLA
jgi:hypothetical protein